GWWRWADTSRIWSSGGIQCRALIALITMITMITMTTTFALIVLVLVAVLALITLGRLLAGTGGGSTSANTISTDGTCRRATVVSGAPVVGCGAASSAGAPR